MNIGHLSAAHLVHPALQLEAITGLHVIERCEVITSRISNSSCKEQAPPHGDPTARLLLAI